ncbi:hypothetical protein AV926_16825 [Myroides marinus]|uniref:Uncharacterized protein n=1 Tax=Myroides marinus TaxID=703342 RepID=A0A163W185_9FLAO|nr:hypothetical protein AV926_16825 [Myroides marinus]
MGTFSLQTRSLLHCDWHYYSTCSTSLLRKKTHLIQLYNQNKKEKIHLAYKIILSIMFSTWFILGYVIKMSLNGNQ